MKRKIKPPFFEIGVKNYLFGDQVLELALAADAAAAKYDIDVLFITPYTEIRRVAEAAEHLIVFAPYMDLLRPGSGMADILPEALKAAGAAGVVLNHSERPISLYHLMKGIQRADELEMLSFVCTGSIPETQAAAQLHPDIINPEPAELIGTSGGGDISFTGMARKAARKIDSGILIEHAAGISCADDVYNGIKMGFEGVGVASGICRAADPCAMAEKMIYAVRRALEDGNR